MLFLLTNRYSKGSIVCLFCFIVVVAVIVRVTVSFCLYYVYMKRFVFSRARGLLVFHFCRVRQGPVLE